jgi:hypothetical protein
MFICTDPSSFIVLAVQQSPLYTSPHWVLGITCPLQHTDAGVEQGVFVALAQQPLLQVSSNCCSMCCVFGS